MGYTLEVKMSLVDFTFLQIFAYKISMRAKLSAQYAKHVKQIRYNGGTNIPFGVFSRSSNRARKNTNSR